MLTIRKIIFSVIIWIFFLLTYVGFSYMHLKDPATSFYDEFYPFYEFAKITALVLFSI